MKQKSFKRPILIALLIVSIVLIAGVLGVSRFGSSVAAHFLPSPTPDPLEGEVRSAIDAAIDTEMPQAMALLLYETRIEQIQISADRTWATAWMIPLDPENGEVVPVEPGLALVHLTTEGWKAFVPSDPLWPLVVAEVPEDLISAEEKAEWLQISEYREAAVTAPLRGYYLPWTGGDTMVLTQSVGHDRYTPSGSAHFAFDFAKPGYPSAMYNVIAAKGGIVKQAVWIRENGDPERANYLVLEDTSTNPTSYQLYLHLAKDSIPAKYRVVGTPVQRGALIGIADDTGVSSGNHLHFMVHTYASSYWGSSVDIQFEDVSINGGRPRIASDLPYCKSSDVCTTTQTSYVSGNFLSPDHIAPTGGITSPPQGALINTASLPLQGWAKDENSGIASAQFKAFFSGGWHDLGSPFSTQDFSYSWDMCADQVPDGPVSLALTIRDKAQNQAEGLPGLTHFTKNYECPQPPPTCSPSANQVALFANTDLQGACVVLSAGSYLSPTQLGDLGDDNAASIQVGSNVQATLFTKNNLAGRGEAFFSSDFSLTDNLIGKDSLSSVIVKTKTALPSVPRLVYPQNGTGFAGDASLTLSWENAGGATEFQLQLLLGTTQVLTTPWSPQTFWHSSALSPGDYTWKVKARNSNGETNWSSLGSFQVAASQSAGAQATSGPLSVPMHDDMEALPGNWAAVAWSSSPAANHTQGGSLGWKYDPGSASGYDTGSPNSGYLTSPAISIPGSGASYLRFYYRYETEDEGVHWDQRWVQISANGGPFNNLFQLSDDPVGYWLKSPAISLADYAGQEVRIRFYFVTRDGVLNQLEGWYLDDFSVTTEPPPDCGDSQNSIPQALLISDGQTLDGVICPGGDVDFYKFQGLAGDQVGIRTQAQVNGSPLDTHLTLIDSDGKSPLATNDDILQYERTDSFIYYRLKRTGLYYLRVRAWDHPNAGAENATYSLSLFVDSQDPEASFSVPQENSPLPGGVVNLSVAARDDKSGVGLVRFYWHSNDWQGSNWVELGVDWDPGDGWNFAWDTSGISNRNGVAVYALVFDWAGNYVGTGAWNLHQPMIYLPLVRKSR